MNDHKELLALLCDSISSSSFICCTPTPLVTGVKERDKWLLICRPYISSCNVRIVGRIGEGGAKAIDKKRQREPLTQSKPVSFIYLIHK